MLWKLKRSKSCHRASFKGPSVDEVRMTSADLGLSCSDGVTIGNSIENPWRDVEHHVLKSHSELPHFT